MDWAQIKELDKAYTKTKSNVEVDELLFDYNLR